MSNGQMTPLTPEREAEIRKGQICFPTAHADIDLLNELDRVRALNEDLRIAVLNDMVKASLPTKPTLRQRARALACEMKELEAVWLSSASGDDVFCEMMHLLFFSESATRVDEAIRLFELAAAGKTFSEEKD